MKKMLILSGIIVMGILLLLSTIISYGALHPGTDNTDFELNYDDDGYGRYSGSDSDSDSSSDFYSSTSNSTGSDLVGSWYTDTGSGAMVYTFENNGDAQVAYIDTSYVHPTPKVTDYTYEVNGDYLEMTIKDASQGGNNGYLSGEFKVNGNQLILKDESDSFVLQKASSYENALDMIAENNPKVEDFEEW